MAGAGHNGSHSWWCEQQDDYGLAGLLLNALLLIVAAASFVVSGAALLVSALVSRLLVAYVAVLARCVPALLLALLTGALCVGSLAEWSSWTQAVLAQVQAGSWLWQCCLTLLLTLSRVAAVAYPYWFSTLTRSQLVVCLAAVTCVVAVIVCLLAVLCSGGVFVWVLWTLDTLTVLVTAACSLALLCLLSRRRVRPMSPLNLNSSSASAVAQQNSGAATNSQAQWIALSLAVQNILAIFTQVSLWPSPSCWLLQCGWLLQLATGIAHGVMLPLTSQPAREHTQALYSTCVRRCCPCATAVSHEQ